MEHNSKTNYVMIFFTCSCVYTCTYIYDDYKAFDEHVIQSTKCTIL